MTLKSLIKTLNLLPLHLQLQRPSDPYIKAIIVYRTMKLLQFDHSLLPISLIGIILLKCFIVLFITQSKLFLKSVQMGGTISSPWTCNWCKHPSFLLNTAYTSSIGNAGTRTYCTQTLPLTINSLAKGNHTHYRQSLYHHWLK